MNTGESHGLFLHRICNSLVCSRLLDSDHLDTATVARTNNDYANDYATLAVAAHIAMRIEARPTGPGAFEFKINSTEGMDDDSLTREMLKLALSNEKAWLALRRLFLEHTMPEKLDPMGQAIRKILQQLDLGERHGESQKG